MQVRALVVGTSALKTSLVDTLRVDQDIDAEPLNGFANLVEEVRSRRPDIVVMAPATQPQALAAVQKLMAQEPVPILVIRGETWSEESVVKAGAVDSMVAPDADAGKQADLRSRVRLVSKVKTIRHIRGRERIDSHHVRVPIVAIAASTGGPQAVIRVLEGLDGIEASVLVVQHLHPSFTEHFLEWIERASPLPAQIATHGTVAQAGSVYVAPGNLHLLLGVGRRLELSETPNTLHRPSADVLFRSVAELAGQESVGVLLTGMGNDGAAGLLEMRHAGAFTIAQDKESSVIFGMPAVAQELGAAEHVLPLEEIPRAIMRAAAMVG